MLRVVWKVEGVYDACSRQTPYACHELPGAKNTWVHVHRWLHELMTNGTFDCGVIHDDPPQLYTTHTQLSHNSHTAISITIVFELEEVISWIGERFHVSTWGMPPKSSPMFFCLKYGHSTIPQRSGYLVLNLVQNLTAWRSFHAKCQVALHKLILLAKTVLVTHQESK